MKRIRATIVFLLFSILCLCGCQSAGSNNRTSDGVGIKIYVTLSEGDAFRRTLIEAAEQTAKEAGAEIVVYEADNSIENQVAQMKQAVLESYDVIMCAAVDADTAQELEAIAGDIPIVFFNSCPDESVLEEGKYMYVGSDETTAGQYQAEYILAHFGNQKELNIAFLKGVKNHSATDGRKEGLKNTLAASGKTVSYVFEDYADWDADLAERYFHIFLRTGKTADVVVCQNDTMAMGVIRACEENGLEDVVILGIDATEDGCAAILAGTMDFTVYQSAKGQGEMAVKAAIALATGNSTKDLEGVSKDGCYIWVPFEKVDRSNVSQYQ